MTRTKAAVVRNKKPRPNHPSAPASSPRTRAERLLRHPRRDLAHLPADDADKLMHELQAHEIELEMQNDELRRTQLELEQARDRYANLYDFAPTAHLTLSASSEILEANLSAGELLGLERGKLIHRRFSRFLPPDARGTLSLLCRRAFSSDARQSVELAVVTAKSKRLVVQLEAVPDPTSPRKQLRVSLTDITQRKDMEKALRESEAQLRFALETIHTGAWDLDLLDHTTLRSIEHDRIFGYPEFLPRWTYEMFLEHVLPEDRALVDGKFSHAVESHGDWNFECRIRRADGVVRWIRAAGRPREAAAGTRRRMTGIVQDITDRKRAEEHIAQLSRVQAILAGIDRAIVHIPDRQNLLDEVCRVAVDQGGFKLAWIGMAAPDGSIQPVAQAGATEYLKGVRMVTQDVPEGRGPVGTAIRENRPVVIGDINQSASMALWRGRARRLGLRYVAAFPLRLAGKVAGAFQVYAPRADFFDDNELGLLTQVSDDISFALTAMADLAARQQAEAAFLDSNRFNQEIIASAKDGIIVYSRDLKYLVWNPFMEELTGIGAVDVIGKHPLEVFPFLREAGVIQQLNRVLAGAASTPLDFPYRVPQTGRSGWVSDINAPLRNAKGEITGVMGIVRDITQRKQAEHSLRRSEQNLATFFDHSPIGLEWLSASGNILRANQAQLDLLGCSPEEYLGHFFGEFCSDPAATRELLEAMAANETVRNRRILRRHKDGTLRVVLLDAQPLWLDGQFLYSSIFSRDITDRVNLERELLEISEREHRRIAQDLHDGLGQILVGAAYLGSTLRQDLAAKSLPEVRQLDRLLRLVDEAIGQTRNLARGLHPVKPEPNGLMAALQDLASRTKTLFNVRCRFLCRQPVLIEDSPISTHLFRIAQEAVTNAIKHGKPGLIHISLTRTPGRISLAVRDDGVGLPPRPRKPRGLGLRIMRYRAGTIGGSLAIQKEPTGGTTVVCTVHQPTEFPPNSPERTAGTWH